MFIEISILIYFDFKNKIIIKINVLNFVIVEIIFQLIKNFQIEN